MAEQTPPVSKTLDVWLKSKEWLKEALVSAKSDTQRSHLNNWINKINSTKQ